MIKLKVVTPDKVIVDSEVENVSIPTTTGMITVLDRHTPLVSTIKVGEMVVRKEGVMTRYAVYEGLVNIRLHGKGVTEVAVLLESSESIEDLDKESAEKALKRAHELSLEEGNDEDFTMFEGLLEKELHRAEIVKKYRKKL